MLRILGSDAFWVHVGSCARLLTAAASVLVRTLNLVKMETEISERSCDKPRDDEENFVYDEEPHEQSELLEEAKRNLTEAKVKSQSMHKRKVEKEKK
ncbi:hypothetical protein VNO80_20442 [Phaseolus coccineus]|uniref:Uncharacterized protein n=1 Tax=Phaseolus coccineus TaxID=3886 RepID=A0AAN9MI49_PHACN